MRSRFLAPERHSDSGPLHHWGLDHFGGAPDTHPVLACTAEIGESFKAVAQVDTAFISPDDRPTALLALSR